MRTARTGQSVSSRSGERCCAAWQLHEMVRLAAFVALVFGCGPRSKPPDQPEEKPKPHADWLGNCTCAELGQPIETSTLASDVVARWQRTAAAIEPAYLQIGALYATGCPAPEAVVAVLAAHDSAIREASALDRGACDHFSAWLFANSTVIGKATDQIVMGTLSCGRFAGPAWDRMNDLVITRGC